MSKKKVAFSLCFSLLLLSSTVAPSLFAASVETVGDLKVQGVVESSSGGFKFPDGSTLTTAGLSGLLFNVGFVVDNSGSNAGNLLSGAIKFGAGDGATGEGIASQRIGSGNVNGIDFYTNSTSRLAVTNGGFVGIGTRAPGFALDVRSTKHAAARFGYNGGSVFIGSNGPLLGLNGYWDGTPGSAGWRYGDAGSAGLIWWYNNGFNFLTAASGSAGATFTPATRMFLSNDGKLGIGTETPSEKLEVVGNIGASGAVSGASAYFSGSAGNGIYALTSASNGNGILAIANVGASAYGVYGSSSTGYGVVGTTSGTATAAGRFSSSASNGTALIAESGGTQVLKVDATGVHAGAGLTGTPLAYGVFNGVTGSRMAGSANITCSWISDHYECAITGETYHYAQYITNVTPSGTFAIPETGSIGGLLLVYFHNTAGGNIQVNSFSVTVYKP